MHWPIGAYRQQTMHRPARQVGGGTQLSVGLLCLTHNLDVVMGARAVMSLKFLNHCYADAPDDIKSYVDIKRIIDFRWLNVTAGRPRWTNNREAIKYVLKQSIQWRPQQVLFAANMGRYVDVLSHTI